MINGSFYFNSDFNRGEMALQLLLGSLVLINVCLLVSVKARGCCPNGWLVYEDSCYLFADEIKVDWTSAIHFCESHLHAHLATVETRDEDMFLKEFARKLFKGHLAGAHDVFASFWLGASDDEVESNWVWYTNHQRLNYTSFANVAESQSPDQDCLILWGDYNMEWADDFCGANSHPICEIEIENYMSFLENAGPIG
ncbi:perlucin-like [Dreissena polymorpha]|uniref:C-type lectin domain-containing protein n=1 Tax=Dreissena polymorpha TaxID=45954 RepID=A0A9D4L875_DREPO|nr:perlucin-like [Dreissena polymorpha]KAH3853820.1 hypothetical protein DPMN_096355 [Dreissena polymorpha]